jgi:hypothetical protein
MKPTLPIVVLAAALGLAGCQDMGLEYPLPVEDSERPPYALVAAVMAPAEVADLQVIADGRLWVSAGLPLALSDADVQPVGTSDGATVFARTWDAPPYDELFMRIPAGAVADTTALLPTPGFLAFAPVIGGGGSGSRSAGGETSPGH